MQDTAAATEHILLAAVALGLGGCWVSAFDEHEAARVLNLPQHHRPVASVPLGKPMARPASHTSRRPVSSVATCLG